MPVSLFFHLSVFLEDVGKLTTGEEGRGDGDGAGVGGIYTSERR